MKMLIITYDGYWHRKQVPWFIGVTVGWAGPLASPHVHIYIYIYVYVHIHIYIYLYIHTYMYLSLSLYTNNIKNKKAKEDLPTKPLDSPPCYYRYY